MQTRQTIAAVSTPPGEGGVSVIRLSGAEALLIALKLFRSTSEINYENIKARYMYFGGVFDPAAGEPIDSGLMVFMPSPHSFTGEDVVEFHCHGGLLIQRTIVAALVKNGAHPASPGEFTRRAFLNGKLDLVQAESIIDMIKAETELTLSSARGRLDGYFSRRVNSIKEPLLKLLTHVEAALDFSEEGVEEAAPSAIQYILEKAKNDINELLATYAEGRVIKDGVRVLILGRTNAGKSSLLNILLQEDRAIVTAEAGTTRDVLEEKLNIRGIPVVIMDTAGLRHAKHIKDEAEAIGIKRALSRIKEAELIIYAVDATLKNFEEDIENLKSAADKKLIVVANKIDLPFERGLIEDTFSGRTIKYISAVNHTGIEGLKDAIFESACGHPYAAKGAANAGELVTNARHRDALDRAAEGLTRAEASLNNAMPMEFIATDIRWSIDRLGEITGETTTEDILERIFSSFCIGK